jgi:membrane associated rhomboid family serine protease
MFLVLPIGDEPNHHVRRPVVTWLLIAANVAVFVWMLSEGGTSDAGQERMIRQWGYVPADGRPITILTHMFAHAGWVHLIGNMLFLWIFGDNVESRLGHLGFLALYVLTGVAALHAHLWFGGGDPQMPLVGASGAVSGVQGLYFVACPGARVKLFFWMLYVVRVSMVPARALMVVWFLINDVLPVLVKGQNDNVAHWAHLGGFAAGLLCMLLLVPFLGRNEPPPRPNVFERYPHRLRHTGR